MAPIANEIRGSPTVLRLHHALWWC